MFSIFIFKKRKNAPAKKGPVKKVSAQSKKLRAEARSIVHDRLAYFNQHYGLSYNRVFIKNQKTRWGSCSSNKNLNFNYRIAILPPELQDYLIVHELCHLQEMNHGAGFWSLVAEQVPKYRECRAALRKIPVR